MAKSLAEELADLPEDEYNKMMEGFTEQDLEALQYDADFWLRPEQKIWEGDQSWATTAVTSGRGWGKLICISTRIPTPSGWKILADIKDGDTIFDEQGMPCKVVKSHDVALPEKAYRLTFSDGSTLDAGGEHLWTTWDHQARKSYNRRNPDQGLPNQWPTWESHKLGVPTGIGPKTLTTQEIVDTFRQGKRGDLNHSIPVTMPLQYSTKNLAVDPYIFGYWLGDGSAGVGEFTAHIDDTESFATYATQQGYDVRVRKVMEEGKNTNTISLIGLRTKLRSQGSLKNKSIPREYLEGDVVQRKQLLAGLLDSDGYIDPTNSNIEFCAMRKEHADAVYELAASLGQKPKMYTGEATLNGRSYGTKYRVKWRPTFNPFYLSRKRDGYSDLGNQKSRTMHRMITSFEEIPVKPMRCLTVDSPNRLFLVGESMIPTHNTRCASEWIRHKAMTEPGCVIAVAGRTAGDVRRVMVEGVSGILAVHPEADRPEYKQQKATIYWKNGSKAELHSSEAPDSARGPQYHYTVGDEFAAWKTDEDSSGATLFTNLEMATRLGNRPQMLLTTTPKRTKTMREVYNRAKDPNEKIRLITGKTTDNTNLSHEYLSILKRRYGNSDLARQELEGEMLDEAEGLIFTDDMLNKALNGLKLPNYPLKIIAVDPSVSADIKTADECGIMAMASTLERDLTKRRALVLEDHSLTAPPDVWAQVVVDAAKKHGTKFVVVEKNQGGDLLRMVIQAKDPSLKVFTVTATKGKLKRAEPVVVAMQQGRIVFNELFVELWDQLSLYDPESSSSPDRMDAFVWGAVALLVAPPEGLHVPRSSSYNTGRVLLPSTGLGSGRSHHTSSIKIQR